MHKNVAFNMALVQLLFLFGSSQTDNKVNWRFYLATQQDDLDDSVGTLFSANRARFLLECKFKIDFN